MRRQHLPILTVSAFGLIAISIILTGTWKILPGALSQTPANSAQEQVSAAQLAAAVAEQRLAAALLTRSDSFYQRFQKLSDRAQRKGTVPVILRVRAAFQPEGQLLHAAQRLAQRSLIKEAQDQLLAELKYLPSSLKRFTYVPYLAVVVDTERLAQLQSSANVLELIEDKSLKLATAESLPLVGATTSWAGGYTGNNKTIAILDSGVDKTHPDLTGKVVSEACYSTDNPTGDYQSLCPDRAPSSTAVGSGIPCTDVPGLAGGCYHGTHIAGTAAGRSGVAFNANIISIQVMSLVTDQFECGSENCLRAKTSDTVLALERVYALSMSNNPAYNIAAVNISLVTDAPMEKYGATCDEVDSSLTAIINQLKSVGIATIVAAGNYGYTDGLSFPACISSAISVGATGDGSSTGTLTDRVIPDSNSAYFLNLLAPGGAITAPIPGTGYATAAGTSQAAAHVSGAMALLREECPIGTNSTVWFDDALPAGAVPAPDNTATGGVVESWNWVSANPTPHSGTQSHQSSISTGVRDHFFTNATSTMEVNAGDILYAWAYLDPVNKPSTIMLQWNDGTSWNHGAYWGANEIPFSQDGAQGRINMGRLPEAGRWVKLVVPAHAVGLEGVTVSGMAFSQYGGRVTWDQTGKESASVDDLLTLLRSTGVPVTDTRPGATNLSIPRIRIGTAMGVNPPDESWLGAYFNNTNLEGEPVLVRNDGVGFIDPNIQGISPAPGIGITNYSIRWSRNLTVTAGLYRFSVTGDDGVRLYIDDQLLVNEWSNKTVATSYNVDVNLSPGTHRIRLEYYQAEGGAIVRLRWKLFDPLCSQTVSQGRWKGEYFNNINLAGSPAMVSDDGGEHLDKNFGAGSPNSLCAMFGDRFSARWTRWVELPAGPHRFFVGGDDGVRFYLNGTRLVDRWVDQGYTVYTTDVNITTPGNYKLELEFYDNGLDARASVDWSNCNLTLSSSGQLFSVGGGSGSFNVMTGAGCQWNAITANSWIPITGGATGAGNGTVSFNVQSNSGGWRTGSISVGERVFTVTQCGYSVSPTSLEFPATGGQASVHVTTAAGCSWTAANGIPHLPSLQHISPNFGTGSGTVSVTVGPYGGGPTPLTGKITVAGRTVTITQRCRC